MKNQLFLISLFSIILSFTPNTAKAEDNVALRICEYVAANDKNRLRSYLKEKKLKLRKIFSTISCNDDNLLIFAAKNKGLEVGEFIIGKTPSKVVADNLEELKKHSKHLAEEATERLN